jgi:nicotinamidase-related amidase
VDGEGASNEVLSTVLDAVNIGFRVLIVEDALRSSSDAGPRRADDDVPPAFQ